MAHNMALRLIPLALLLASTASVAASPLPPLPAYPANAVFHDKRIAINVTQAEKNQVLYEMREFLHGLHNIFHALSRQDMNALAVAARPMGPLLDRTPARMKERLPEEYTQLSIAMNEAFQALARDAESKGDLIQAHENLAEVMTYCSGCHDTYRFNVAPLKIRK